MRLLALYWGSCHVYVYVYVSLVSTCVQLYVLVPP